MIETELELCITGAVCQRFKGALVVDFFGTAVDVVDKLVTIAEFLRGMIIGREAFQIERYIDRTGVLGEPALEGIVIIDLGPVAGRIWCLGPFETLAVVTKGTLGRTVTDQDVITAATFDEIIARTRHDCIIA